MSSVLAVAAWFSFGCVGAVSFSDINTLALSSQNYLLVRLIIFQIVAYDRSTVYLRTMTQSPLLSCPQSKRSLNRALRHNHSPTLALDCN